MRVMKNVAENFVLAEESGKRWESGNRESGDQERTRRTGMALDMPPIFRMSCSPESA